MNSPHSFYHQSETRHWVSDVDIIKQLRSSNVRVGWGSWWENSRIKWFIRVRCHESSINSKPSSYTGALCVNRFYQTTIPDQSKHFTDSQLWLLKHQKHQLLENTFPHINFYLRPDILHMALCISYILLLYVTKWHHDHNRTIVDNKVDSKLWMMIKWASQCVVFCSLNECDNIPQPVWYIIIMTNRSLLTFPVLIRPDRHPSFETLEFFVGCFA